MLFATYLNLSELLNEISFNPFDHSLGDRRERWLRLFGQEFAAVKWSFAK
jgi:hypothetical protein